MGTGIETLVTAEGHRRAIERSFETARNEPGLDHDETRGWHGWRRHVSLVMLAFALMATIRHLASSAPLPKLSVASSLPISSHGQSGEEPIKPQPKSPYQDKIAPVMLEPDDFRSNHEVIELKSESVSFQSVRAGFMRKAVSRFRILL